MTAAPEAALTALDFAPTCQCPVHPCTSVASFVVERHALHRCDEGDLTVDGNRVELLCSGCVSRLRVVVAGQLARFRVPGRYACETCGAPVAEVGDVVRSIERL